VTCKAKRSNNKVSCLLIIVLLLCSYSHVRSSNALGINPSRAEIFVGPGEEARGEYTVLNEDDKPIRVVVFPEKHLIREGRDATSWIKIWPADFNIPANSSKKVNYSVRAPDGVEGEYTSSMVFRSLSPVEITAAIGGTAQIRLVTYVMIKGTEIIKCEISRLEVLNTRPFNLSVRVKNSGNIHLRPTGIAEIVRLVKEKERVKEESIIKLRLNPREGPIHPDREGEIGLNSEDVKLEEGEYKVRVNVNCGQDVILKRETKFTAGEVKED